MPGPDPISPGQLKHQLDSLPVALQLLVKNALDSGLSWPQISDILGPALSDGTADGNELQQLGDFLRDLPLTQRPEGSGIPPGQFRDFVEQALGADPNQRSAVADVPLAGDPRNTAYAGAALANPNAAQPPAGRDAGAALFANAQAQAQTPAQAASAQQASVGAPLAQAPADRVQLPGAQAAQNVRAETVATPARADSPTVVNLQQQAPVVSATQGRTDLLGAQVLPQVAGAVMLANPQAVAPPGHTGLVVPAGHDAAAAQARDAALAPAGHTNASTMRRQERRNTQAPQTTAEGLLALLPGRRRRGLQGEAEPTTFQWLFWILTVLAYGAVAIAVIAMVSGAGGSRGLTNAYGELSFGAYALIVGGTAALASWFVGRRLAKR